MGGVWSLRCGQRPGVYGGTASARRAALQGQSTGSLAQWFVPLTLNGFIVSAALVKFIKKKIKKN